MLNKDLHHRVYARDGGGRALNQERQHRTGAGSTLHRLLFILLPTLAIWVSISTSAATERTPQQDRRALEHVAHAVRQAAQDVQLVCTEIKDVGHIQRMMTLHQRVEALQARVQRLEAVVNTLPPPRAASDETQPSGGDDAIE